MTTDEAIEVGAKAWFDRVQSQRWGADSRRPDGLRWQWDDLTEDDKRAYRALVAPVATAVLRGIGECEHEPHWGRVVCGLCGEQQSWCRKCNDTLCGCARA